MTLITESTAEQLPVVADLRRLGADRTVLGMVGIAHELGLSTSLRALTMLPSAIKVALGQLDHAKGEPTQLGSFESGSQEDVALQMVLDEHLPAAVPDDGAGVETGYDVIRWAAPIHRAAGGLGQLVVTRVLVPYPDDGTAHYSITGGRAF